MKSNRCIYCGRELTHPERNPRACLRHYHLMSYDPHTTPELRRGVVKEWKRLWWLSGDAPKIEHR